MSIPGIAPPFRHAGRLLVDGGVLNNLPVDHMAEVAEGPIVAVDVIRRMEASSEARSRALPTIAETLARATVLGSVERAERNRALALVLVTPDVEAIKLRNWSALDEAVEAGRAAATARARERRRREAAGRARRGQSCSSTGSSRNSPRRFAWRAMPGAQALRLAHEQLDAHVEAARALLVLPDAGDGAVDEHDRRDPAGGAVDAVVDARRQERLARPVVERVDVEDGQQVDRLRPVERA